MDGRGRPRRELVVESNAGGGCPRVRAREGIAGLRVHGTQPDEAPVKCGKAAGPGGNFLIPRQHRDCRGIRAQVTCHPVKGAVEWDGISKAEQGNRMADVPGRHPLRRQS